MKKSLLLYLKSIILAFAMIILANVAVAQTTLYSTDFGTSNAFPTGWTASGGTTLWTDNSTSASSGYTGAWGINAGSNIFYPTLHDYIVSSQNPIESGEIVPAIQLGYFFGISRTFRICKIEKKNPIDVSIGLSYNHISSKLNYKIRDSFYHAYFIGRVFPKEDYPSLDINFSNTLNFKEKYGILNSIGFRTNYKRGTPSFDGSDYEEYYLTYSLGFIFYLKKINIMPMVNTTILDLRKINKGYPYNNYSIFGPIDKDFFQLINFGVSIFFNNPFKKNKDEKK